MLKVMMSVNSGVIEREKVTLLFCVPTQYQMMLERPRFAATDLSSIRFLTSGGAPLPVPIIRAYAEAQGYDALFREVGATVIAPSCGACINAGPGASKDASTVTISAQNRNFPGRSGPGDVWLASPLSVAASAIAGRVVSA